jgi:hypothetical protein
MRSGRLAQLKTVANVLQQKSIPSCIAHGCATGIEQFRRSGITVLETVSTTAGHGVRLPLQ